MRLIKCQKCGKTIEADGEKCFCPECRKKLKSESWLRECECRTCGKRFWGGPASRYCPECRAERIKQQTKECRERKRAGTVRHIGSKDICLVCGKEYTVEGGLQKYCPDCAEEAIREKDRKKSVEWNRQHKDRMEKIEQERKDARKICKVCGAQFRSGKPDVTCSPSCAKALLTYRRAMTDFRRGHQNTAPDMDKIRERLSRQSGVKGVTRSPNGTRWRAKWQNKYLGTYDTVEEAAEAIEKYKSTLHDPD